MKTCTKCKIEKEFTEFGKCKKVKDGLKSSCKSCLRSDNRLYYGNNIEKESNRKKKAYERDSEKIIAKSLEYYYENTEYRSQWVKDKRQEHPEVFQEYGRTFRRIHPKYNAEYRKKRLKTDPLFKLQSLLRTRTGECLKVKRWNKTNTFHQYIGCTLEYLKIYIENQFLPNMTWKNHSKTGWHIDHIIPLDSANTPEEMHKLCHYTNLQPLWAFDNLSKSNRIT